MSKVHTYSTDDPVLPPRSMTREDEFLHLVDHRERLDGERKRVDQRLRELVEELASAPLPAISLPASGLHIRARADRPGAFLFAGGRP